MEAEFESMEIAVLSKFLINDWRDYLFTRVLSFKMCLLAVLLVVAAWCSRWPQWMSETRSMALADAGLTVLLLAQFRLWDDLADLSRDRISDPGRVLCRTQHCRSFRRLLWVWAIVLCFW